MRIVARAQQNEARRQFQAGVNCGRYTAGINVSGVRNNTSARGNFFCLPREQFINLALQLKKIGGIKTASGSSSAAQNALEALPLMDCASVEPAGYEMVTLSPGW